MATRSQAAILRRDRVVAMPVIRPPQQSEAQEAAQFQIALVIHVQFHAIDAAVGRSEDLIYGVVGRDAEFLSRAVNIALEYSVNRVIHGGIS